jgi:UDP:flavonoid glycosyltransferase YjiC (YdhE family)
MRSDQPALAAQVARLGAGITLDGNDASAETIGNAVMTGLWTPFFKHAAQQLGTAITSADAPAAAVQ